MNALEHPGITRCLRDGYPRSDKPIVCDRCEESIEPGTVYGECDGKAICGECANAQWDELNTSERLVMLGFDIKYHG